MRMETWEGLGMEGLWALSLGRREAGLFGAWQVSVYMGGGWFSALL